MEAFLPLLLPLVLAGLFAGFLAGLLGIGGGIVTVPVLYVVFNALGLGGEWAMHMAIATSLAVIIPTSIASARSHHRKGGVDLAVIRSWWLPLAVFAVAGAFVAETLKGEALVLFFAALALFMGLKMMLPFDDVRMQDHLPTSWRRYIAPSVIGFFSAVIGIGGGSFSVPYLTMFGMQMHRAVGTAALGGLVISLTGAVGFFAAGADNAALPEWSLGFVYLPAWIIVAPLSVAMAPFGASVAHRIPRRLLSLLFGLFLIVATARLVYLTFTSAV